MAEYPPPSSDPFAPTGSPYSPPTHYATAETGASSEFGRTEVLHDQQGRHDQQSTTDVAKDKASDTASTAAQAGSQVASSAAQAGSDVASSAAQAGTEVAQTAAEQAKNVASEAVNQARDLAGEARGQLQDQAKQQHERAVTGLRSLADELRSMAERSEQSGPATQIVGQAADRAHGVAQWLSEREPGDLIEELRSFARRRPGAFLLGAAAAGIVAGRLTRGVTSASQSGSNSAQSIGGGTNSAGMSAEPLTAPMPLAGQPTTGFAGYDDAPIPPMPAERPPAAFGDPGGSPVVGGTDPYDPTGSQFAEPRPWGSEPGVGGQPGPGNSEWR